MITASFSSLVSVLVSLGISIAPSLAEGGVLLMAPAASVQVEPLEGASGSLEAAEQEPPRPELGLELGLGLQSAFVWRGYNQFQSKGQMDQRLMLAPMVIWSIGETGIWLGWWSAIQLTGEGVRENIDYGIGLEQDLMIGRDLELSDDVFLSFVLNAYLFPFADKRALGVESLPWYLEPEVELLVSIGYVDLVISASVFGLFPDINDSYSHVYLNPRVSLGLPVPMGSILDLEAGFGRKLLFGEEENTFDILLDMSLPLELGTWTVTPSLHLAWTNLDLPRAIEGLVLWGAVSLQTGL